jgi:hypothetical protein
MTHPYLDHEDPITAVRRVLNRLEFCAYWAYHNEPLERWYAAGMAFIVDHYTKVVREVRNAS